jgi:hypothetical protein
MQKMPLTRTGGRLPVLVLGICFILPALFSENFIITHAEHDCCGDRCPVCLQIQWARNFSRQFRYAPLQNSPSLSVLFFAPHILKPAVFNFVPITSVSLKVKMNE